MSPPAECVVDLNEKVLRQNPLPMPEGDGSKQHRGKVLVIGGSRSTPGAVMLAGVSALRVGAGILQVATCESTSTQLGIALPECMSVGLAENGNGDISANNISKVLKLADDCDACLIGPGMLGANDCQNLTTHLIEKLKNPAIVLDALACSTAKVLLSRPRARDIGIVLTPHAGEMAKLLGTGRDEVERNPLAVARDVAKTAGCVVALKGAETYIAAPDGRTWHCRRGCIGLGTSGSGDALAGIIAGLLARGTEPALAVAWGVYLHAEAGQRLTSKVGTLGMLAREIPEQIPAILEKLTHVGC